MTEVTQSGVLAFAPQLWIAGGALLVGALGWTLLSANAGRKLARRGRRLGRRLVFVLLLALVLALSLVSST